MDIEREYYVLPLKIFHEVEFQRLPANGRLSQCLSELFLTAAFVPILLSLRACYFIFRFPVFIISFVVFKIKLKMFCSLNVLLDA